MDMVAKTSQSVVSIFADTSANYYLEGENDTSLWTTKKETKIGWWSWIIWSKNGYIFTNKHVVEDTAAHYTVVLYDKSTWNVDRIWRDDQLDLAVLHIVDEKGNPPQNIIPAVFIPMEKTVNIGQFSFVIGNSFSEYTNTTSFGIISGKERTLKIDNTNLYAGFYQTDAAINPWNSWWPLLNSNGEIIGIVTAMSRGGTNIGFALPLTQEFVNATLYGILTSNILIRPLLGVSYTDISSWSLVDMVFSDTPAVWILQSGDLIVALQHIPFSSDKPLLYQLYAYKPWDTILFTVIRWNKILQLPITLWWKSK